MTRSAGGGATGSDQNWIDEACAPTRLNSTIHLDSRCRPTRPAARPPSCFRPEHYVEPNERRDKSMPARHN